MVHSATIPPMEQPNMGPSRDKQGTDEACKNPRDNERSSGSTAKASQAQRIPTGSSLNPKRPPLVMMLLHTYSLVSCSVFQLDPEKLLVQWCRTRAEV